MRENTGRFAGVDVLRAFAVGIVMIHHFYSEKFFLAGFGVTLFFVLSSFFATNSLLRFKDKLEAGQMRRGECLRTFYFRRWMRIWPLYYFVLAVTLVAGTDFARASFWWNAAFLSNVRLAATGEWPGRFSHLWSLSSLEQFYLLWPALVLWFPRKRLLPLALGTIALGLAYDLGCEIFNLSPLYWFVVPISSFNALGAGALLSLCAAKVPGDAAMARIRWWTGKVCAPVFVALLACKFFGCVPPGFTLYAGLIASLAFIHFIERVMTVPARSGPARMIFENRFLAHVGRMSYSIFLLHEFTELLIPKFPAVQAVLHSDYRIVLLMPCTILLAHLSWKFIESPVLALRGKFQALPGYFAATPTSNTVFSPLRLESTHRETAKPAVVSASWGMMASSGAVDGPEVMNNPAGGLA
ncbi:MAG TPA: acyltransferase [Chthoniobacteraceae bacterium]|nr:acyltransferase [Chthoniobacteraceae bacterium]